MKLLAVILAALMQVQPQVPVSTKLQFEVASVKPAEPGPNGVRGDCHGADSNFAPGAIGATIPRGRCVITAARLSHLIGIAYGLEMDRIKGGPEFVWGVDRFDISAKAALT